ncbi:MAG: UDP-N-acetylglucosamine 1-carboxyvinyltransferase [Candidatus Symbiodolus clandestinus]
MEKFIIEGGVPLVGEIEISGAKNAVLPLMITTILTDKDIILDNVPYLSDVLILCQLLEYLGVKVVAKSVHGVENLSHTMADSFQLILNASAMTNFLAPYTLVNQMRASFWVLAPLLARLGKAKVSLPGGCKIGTRQIDLHLAVLQAMGATISLQEGYVIAQVKNKLTGINFSFNKISVGATINAIFSASLAEGESIFTHCACEPEIVDLCALLIKMGVEIEGVGTRRIRVVGKSYLNGAQHAVMPDRIEAGTFISAVGLTGGQLTLKGIYPSVIENFCAVFISAGLEISYSNHAVTVSSHQEIQPVNMQTAPYPGFPTDLQAQFMSLMCLANGISMIVERIFENRFMHVSELRRMGANITLQGNLAIVMGKTQFTGAVVTASDLRASICLVLAALVAKNKTIIHDIYHIDRGYSRIEKKLTLCGAHIIRSSCSSNV